MFRPFLVALLGWGLLMPAFAEEPFPWTLRGDCAEVRLPQGERLGLVGISLLGETAWGGYLGPSLLAAVRGERGGFFAGGLEGGLRVPLHRRWNLEGGLFLGGGGGGSAPVGGGFLLRPRLGLSWQGASQRLGLDLTYLRFPGGAIASSQVALRWERTFQSLGLSDLASAAPAFHREFLELRGTRQALRDPFPAMGRIGLAWGHFLGDTFFLQVEGSAAARGRNAGYMDVLAGLGARIALDEGRRFSLRGTLSAGSGGGGGIESGGGFLVKAAGAFQFQATPTMHLVAEAGRLWAPSATYRGTTLTLGVGVTLDAADPSPASTPSASLQPWRLSAGLQRYGSVARVTGDLAPLEQLVIKVEVPLTERCYATGQSGWATGGGAGAWATGLLGLGVQTPSLEGHRLRAELAAGAGGGGGVASRGGALAQGLVGWTWDFSPRWSAHVLGGRVRGIRGGFSTSVVEAGLGFREFRWRASPTPH